MLTEQALIDERQAAGNRSPRVCGDMSGVAYHFAARRQAELNVPVGHHRLLLGRPSACLLDDRTLLRSTPEGAALLLSYEASIAAKTGAECDAEVRAHDAAMEVWNNRIAACAPSTPAWMDGSAGLAGPALGAAAQPKSAFRPRAGGNDAQTGRPYTLTGFMYYQGRRIQAPGCTAR
jgi:hypothetical protein